MYTPRQIVSMWKKFSGHQMASYINVNEETVKEFVDWIEDQDKEIFEEDFTPEDIRLIRMFRNENTSRHKTIASTQSRS